MQRTRRRPRARRPVAVLTAAVIVAGTPLALLSLGVGPAAGAAVQVRTLDVEGPPEPGESRPVPLQVRLTLPGDASASAPAPAVLLAHGFGGTADSVAAQARALAGRGYVVATWTARGFGRSGGRIHLNSPEFEVADAARVLDAVARRPEVRKEAPGDPVVGVTGESYGGALALLLAGTDPRIDAVAPVIMWNDLERALIPSSALAKGAPTPAAAGQGPASGVLKTGWTQVFFSGAGGDARPGDDLLTSVGLRVRSCGRFAADVCRGYRTLLDTGEVTPALATLLRKASPASVAARITAPTLLVQGQRDSLFDLSEADATARAIAGAGTPVAVDWTSGGHDTGLSGAPGGSGEAARFTGRILGWFDAVLRRGQVPDAAARAFHVTVSDVDRGRSTTAWRFPGYPGVAGVPAAALTSVQVDGASRALSSPRDGSPSAITTLPGLGALAAALGERDPDGQVAVFGSAPLGAPVRVLGTPRVRLRVTSTAPDAVLFVSLQVRLASGRTVVPRDLVTPVRVPVTGDAASEVDVALPAFAAELPAGARVQVRVAATDRAFAVPADARRYTVAVPAGRVELPVAPREGAAAPSASRGDGQRPGGSTDGSGSGAGSSRSTDLIAGAIVIGLIVVAVRWVFGRSDG